MAETTPVAPIAPVRKTITVRVETEQAFELFTREIGSWWPLATHSVGLENSTGVSIGTSVGDQLVETLADGTTSVWGTVVRCEPPNVLALTWHAGRPADDATLLEVRFTAGAAGGTVVELVHSGWERWADGLAHSEGYSEGWDIVLDRFAGRAAG
ncbi:MAG TPA: SRPBCC domain-containing protein [Acidimicrobiales bacterium]|nr:SRPBCC domain-containing protein [Acidimicrobiales bacterium]